HIRPTDRQQRPPQDPSGLPPVLRATSALEHPPQQSRFSSLSQSFPQTVSRKDSSENPAHRWSFRADHRPEVNNRECSYSQERPERQLILARNGPPQRIRGSQSSSAPAFRQSTLPPAQVQPCHHAQSDHAPQ